MIYEKEKMADYLYPAFDWLYVIRWIYHLLYEKSAKGRKKPEKMQKNRRMNQTMQKNPKMPAKQNR